IVHVPRIVPSPPSVPWNVTVAVSPWAFEAFTRSCSSRRLAFVVPVAGPPPFAPVHEPLTASPDCLSLQTALTLVRTVPETNVPPTLHVPVKLAAAAVGAAVVTTHPANANAQLAFMMVFMVTGCARPAPAVLRRICAG